MRIGRARQRARRAAHAYARRLGVPPPLVQFTHAPRPGFSAATHEAQTRHVVTFSREALVRPTWTIRAIAAHEVGHMKERHTLRTWRLVLMVAVTLIALAWVAPIPWWASLLASLAALPVALRVAMASVHVNHEIEADRWAVHLGARILRLRERFARHEPLWLHRAIHAYIVAALRKAP